MPEFVSKPVQIEARQWEGGAGAAAQIGEWVYAHGGIAAYRTAGEVVTENGEGEVIRAVLPEALYIHTLEGIMTAAPGTWIIRGTENEFYPCIDSVFRRKYEQVM